MVTLELRATEVHGPLRWRWLLVDAEGRFVTEHQVKLDPDEMEYQAFVDPLGFLRWYTEPDRRVASATALLHRVGSWIGDRVLGSVGIAMMEHSPDAVRVRLPEDAVFLLHRPFYLAVVDGTPLSREVSLLFDLGSRPDRVAKQPAIGRLRVLIACGLPARSEDMPPVQERRALKRIWEQLNRGGKAVEFRFIQESATFEELTSALEDGSGWDMVHISGHGDSREKCLILPDESGTPTALSVLDLAALLRRTRSRIKFICLSACQSSNIDIAEAHARRSPDVSDSDRSPLLTIAAEIARRLDCVVLTTRLPVSDDALAAFVASFYESLLGRHATPAAAVLQATQTTSAEVALDLALAGPTLVGRDADRTVLEVEGERAEPLPSPDEGAVLVGRISELSLAGSALSQTSDVKVVVLHGMPGVGKSALAQELAHRHEAVFERVVRWSPIGDGRDEFVDFGATLARRLPGFPSLADLGEDRANRRLVLALSALLDERSVLLVLDSVEALLAADGTWRTPQWAALFSAFATVRGRSRIIVTSRVRLPTTDTAATLTMPIHPLSAEEAAAFAKDLPNLGSLVQPTVDRVFRRADLTAALPRILQLTAGHPELLKIADAVAGDPQRLTVNLAAADVAAEAARSGAECGGAMAAFIQAGDASPDHDSFLDVLNEWAVAGLAAVPESARLMMWVLCCMEDDDRRLRVLETLETNWADIWRRLDWQGDAPELAASLGALSGVALIRFERRSETDDETWYGIHPCIADAVRADLPVDVREAVDTELGIFWTSIARSAMEQSEVSGLVVRAGLAAAPYLVRLHQWDAAARLLDDAVIRNSAPAIVHAALPYLRRIADATGTPYSYAVLARALSGVEPAEAQRLLRETLDRTLKEQDFQLASAVAGELIRLLRDAGQLAEALEVVERKAEYTRRAGLGPWTQLRDRCQRLEIRYLMGHAEQVLSEVNELRDRIATLSDWEPNDISTPWETREAILDIGAQAAWALRRWREALDLVYEMVGSMQRRDASEYEIANARFNGYWPLLHLGQLDEAEDWLLSCQRIFEDANDISRLAQAWTARAEVEHRRGRPHEAITLEQTALRLKYVEPDPATIASSHYNLASYFAVTDGDPASRVAHRLAAAVIYHLTGMARDLTDTLRALSRDLDAVPESPVPASIGELAAEVDRSEGVHLIALISALGPEVSAEAALDEVIRSSRELGLEETYDLRRHLEHWEPRIAAIGATVGGDRSAAALVDLFLDSLADSADWAALVRVLRRILAGERDEQSLLAELDPIDTAIVRRTLDALAGRVQLTATIADLQLARDEEWQTLVTAVVAATQDKSKAETVIPLLDQMAEEEELVPLANALRRIVAGARDPGPLVTGLDASDTQLVYAILNRLTNDRTSSPLNHQG